ncbi:hypothetical protein KL930_004998 [Ogataea haglerorum]|uniref:Protein YIP n=1 Tax=Ogataea haglerorum TaxID=1937702 RepID=A0AAN6D174_9ASCO|nr:uncharacterized protein KL911_005095 [Ogataea haglerorum]KAG7691702.1 hypothetical protein KL915_005009 [Ogataea haglerorum]KAG7692450.1 hypothetical protein KL951_005055 [Ogataea haglerorum]KAG7702478.1 hypothetical protein KL914_005138 [Ogataea haglerorum]KAG7702654.1 hypothetical protein KL950_005199 [Ogataea haglerorum]KAG7713357.1 hypothetical protein KL913_005157 [Ogataea haglerorum]
MTGNWALDNALNQVESDISIKPDMPQTDNSGSSETRSHPKVPSESLETAQHLMPNTATDFLTSTSFANPQSFLDPILENNNVEIREHQFSGGNTLDESVLTTLSRDLSSIGDKLLSILWPLRLRQRLMLVRRVGEQFSSTGTIMGHTDSFNQDASPEESTNPQIFNEYSKETIQKILDWDLWGPLIFVLSFSLIITYLQSKTLSSGGAGSSESSQIFSASFSLIWIVLAVLSLNIQLVSPVSQMTDNGQSTSGIIGLSFFQCMSILSYTLFPIVLGGLSSIFISWKLLRLIINSIMFLWSILCSWLILAIVNNCRKIGTESVIYGMAGKSCFDHNDGEKRILLMIYPIILVFGLLSWLCVIV